jgi:hypothetical protein
LRDANFKPQEIKSQTKIANVGLRIFDCLIANELAP